MTLLAGDLTTPQRFVQWLGTSNAPQPASPIVSQLISSMTALIYSKLNRARLYSQVFTRTFNGQGTSQLVLPDWPVTNISQLLMGSVLVPASPLPTVVNGTVNTTNSGRYGFRFVNWNGNLPGDPAVLEFVSGQFWPGMQNIQVTYTAGYLISSEKWTVPKATGGGAVQDQVTVLQQLGIWCRDNGVVNTTTGATMTPVAGSASLSTGCYFVSADATPGIYTFFDADVQAGLNVAISYSFIPADLEEACNQMIAERYVYRDRIGVESKSLAGQETVRFARGGYRYQMFPDLPPEVDALISPYVSVMSPAIGADT